MAVVESCGHRGRWARALTMLLRCECWDCQAARRALLRRALRIAATLALGAALASALHPAPTRPAPLSPPLSTLRAPQV